LIEEIKDFLKSKNVDFNELSDSCWLLNLAFLTDVTDKANGLNLELQGKDKHVAQMIGSVKSFKAKLVLWMSHTKMKSLVHLPSMKKMVGESNVSPSPFVGHLQTLLEESKKRFCQIEVTEPAASTGKLIQASAEELELEILDLQNVVVLKSYAQILTY
jgi:hypothetical protein